MMNFYVESIVVQMNSLENVFHDSF